VVAGIVVSLPMLARPVCLPVAARLVRKNTVSASRLWLARQIVYRARTRTVVLTCEFAGQGGTA